MSNSMSQKAIKTHHQQVDNAKLRKLKRQYERQQAFENRRAAHRQDFEDYIKAQVAFMLFWLFGVFGITIIYFHYIVR